MLTWGVFIKRLTLTSYLFRSDDDVYEVNLMQNSNPLLHTVRYYVKHTQYQGSLIVDARRIEWNQSVHAFYAADLAYVEPFDIDFYKEKTTNPEFHLWMIFDAVFNIQQLVPIAAVEKFRRYVYEGNFEGLVYTFGNVVPEVLARFLPEGMNHPLVFDAILLQYLCDCMCRHVKVWLNKSDIVMLTYSSSKMDEACARLAQKDIVRISNEQIAFTWAVLQLEEAIARGVQVEFQDLAKPARVCGVAKKEFKVDPRLSIDKFVASKKLPTSVLCPPIPADTPTFGEVKHFSQKREMLEHIKEIHAEKSTHPILILSETGLVSVQTTCQTIKMSKSFKTLKENEIARATCKWNDASVFIITKVDGTKIHIHTDEYYTAAVAFQNLTFQDIHEIPSQIENTVIIACFANTISLKWAHSLRMFEQRNFLYLLKY